MNVLQAEKNKTYIVKNINLKGDIERRLEMLGMTNKVKLSILNKKKSWCCNFKN